MASGFQRLLGVTQGRLAPVFEPPLLGTYVFCLGSDRPGDFQRLAVGGDQFVLSQSCDITGIKLIRFRAVLRAPTAMPSVGTTLDTVVSATGLGTTPAPTVPIAPKWVFSWGFSSNVCGSRTLVPGKRTTVNDGAIDVSNYTGVQTLQFTLALSA